MLRDRAAEGSNDGPRGRPKGSTQRYRSIRGLTGDGLNVWTAKPSRTADPATETHTESDAGVAMPCLHLLRALTQVQLCCVSRNALKWDCDQGSPRQGSHGLVVEREIR